jgi:predicted nucleotidyltransferase
MKYKSDISVYRAKTRCVRNVKETINEFVRLRKIDMSIMKRPELVNKIKEILRKVTPQAEIFLYGSEARGDDHVDSDVDLLILINKEKLILADITKITYPLYDLELSKGVSISPFVCTRKQWFNRPFKTPFTSM